MRCGTTFTPYHGGSPVCEPRTLVRGEGGEERCRRPEGLSPKPRLRSRGTGFTRVRVWLGLLAAVSACAAVCPVVYPIDARGAEPIPPPHVIKPPKLPDADGTPLTIDLDVGGSQVVGGGIVATFAVMARQLQEKVQIQIVLPDGVQQTAGDAAWEGTMGPGEVRIVEVSAKLSSPGSKRFIGRVTLPGKPALTVERTFDVQPAPSPVKPKK